MTPWSASLALPKKIHQPEWAGRVRSELLFQQVLAPSDSIATTQLQQFPLIWGVIVGKGERQGLFEQKHEAGKEEAHQTHLSGIKRLQALGTSAIPTQIHWLRREFLQPHRVGHIQSLGVSLGEVEGRKADEVCT